MDILVKKIGDKQSFEKKIIFVTYCGANLINEVDDAQVVMTECKKRGIKINIMYVLQYFSSIFVI